MTRPFLVADEPATLGVLDVVVDASLLQGDGVNEGEVAGSVDYNDGMPAADIVDLPAGGHAGAWILGVVHAPASYPLALGGLLGGVGYAGGELLHGAYDGVAGIKLLHGRPDVDHVVVSIHEAWQESLATDLDDLGVGGKVLADLLGGADEPDAALVGVDAGDYGVARDPR